MGTPRVAERSRRAVQQIPRAGHADKGHEICPVAMKSLMLA
jgi:hypothetical protein